MHNCIDYIDDGCSKCMEEHEEAVRQGILEIIRNYAGMKNDFLDGLASDIEDYLDNKMFGKNTAI